MNAFKKRLFDKYLEEHHTATPNASESYDEWEADQTKRPPQVPSWATRVLKIPGGGLFKL